MKTLLLLLFLYVTTVTSINAQMVTTFAGNGTCNQSYSGDGGPATAANLYDPTGIDADASGNIYIADALNNVIRKVAPDGTITTIAGTGSIGFSGDGGPATAAQLYHPYDVAVAPNGDIYFTDGNGDKLRKINSAGIISTVTNYPGGYVYSGDGGHVSLARFGNISGIAIDNAGNLYISDFYFHVVRKVDPAGIITTVAGTGTSGYSGDGGPATAAMISHPYEVMPDNAGGFYIPDSRNHCIRKVDASGIITTYAGTGVQGYSGDNGPAIAAQFNFPSYSAIDAAGNLYVVDGLNWAIRKISTDGTVTTYMGDGTYGNGGENDLPQNAQIGDAGGIAIDNAGNIYIVNRGFCTVKKIPYCPAPVITQQPVDVNLCGSGNALFSVNASGDISRRWQMNNGSGWVDLVDDATYNGTATHTLTISAATPAMDGFQYRIKLTNACGPIYSSTSRLNSKIMTTPAITIDPASMQICSGASVTFTATATNAGSSPVYQWRKNGLTTGSNGNIYTDVQLIDGDEIICMLTSNQSCVTSVNAISNHVIIDVVQTTHPGITIQSSGNNICPGTPVTFSSIISDGGVAPVYQWRKNGDPIGTNSDTYSDVTLNNNDIIYCELITGNFCAVPATAVSNQLHVAVKQTGMPGVSIRADKNAVCEGAAVTFYANIVNGTALEYEWRINNRIEGNNAAELKVDSITENDIVTCIVTAANDCFTPAKYISQPFKITTFTPPVVNLDKNPELCYGEKRVLDPGVFTNYLWSTGSRDRTISVSAPGVYTVIVTNDKGCTGSDTASILSFRECLKGFFIPNSFTPNRDGKNDIFKPIIAGNVHSYEFIIYNRWGQLLFKTNNPSAGWDGIAFNRQQPSDTYVWTCSFQLNDQPHAKKQGTLTLLR